MHREKFLIPVVLGLASVISAAPQDVGGQRDCRSMPLTQQGYSVASLSGDYSAIATYGGNVARALGTQTFDGCGKLDGAAFVNQPGPGGTRVVVNITFTGTYTVNSDGTGKMVLTITLPNGTTANATEDFVIARAQKGDSGLIATEVIDAQEQPSTVIPGGVFVTHTYILRPE